MARDGARRPAFFDTNVILYCDDSRQPEKQTRAIELVKKYQRAGLATVSLQVLQEYFVAATRKLGVDSGIAQRKVELLARMRVVRLAEDDVIAAIEFHRLNRISFWDALIVQAARTASVEILFSEDLQSGAVLGGVRVVNPFAAGPGRDEV